MAGALEPSSRFSFARWLRPEKTGGSTRGVRDDQVLTDELREDLAARDAALEDARREATVAGPGGARLLAPFERLEATNDGIEGTGLGLTLCRGLIQRMGGAIGVDSTRGQGATFWLELPSTAEVASPTVMDAGTAWPRPCA